MDRFDRFTDGAQKVLTEAQGEAVRFRHNYISTEHLLLGLLNVDDDLGAAALSNLGADPSKVRWGLEFILARGDRPVLGEMGLTPAAKRVIEFAIDEARRMDHRYVGTEHLLLGLVREGDGIAAGVLESVGIELEKLRHEVTRLVGESPATHARRTPIMAAPVPVSIDEATRALDVSRAYAEIAASPLHHVVGIGQGAVDAGVSVELIALEIRGAGCVLYWKAHRSQDGLLGGPQGAVGDDVGTDYSLQSGVWTGNGYETKGEMLLVPEPPTEATTMQVDLGSFVTPPEAPSKGGEDIRGTWHFEFVIRA